MAEKEEIKTESVFGSEERLSAQEIQSLRALLQAFPIHNHDGRNSLEVATKKVKSSIIAERITSPADMVAGETIANGDAIRITSSDFNVLTADPTTVVSSSNALTAGQKLGQSFTINNFESGATTKNLVVQLKGGSSHTATIRASIFNNSGSFPGSTEHVFEEKSVSLDGSAYASVTFNLSGYAPTAGTTYWMVVTYVSGGGSCTVGRFSGDWYTNAQNPAGSWGSDTDQNDWWVQLGLSEPSANKIFLANARSSDMKSLFVGIADSNATSGQSIEYISFGSKLDFTNLTSGDIYYLQNTAGDIANSYAATSIHIIPVGKAISTEILSIQLPSLT